MLSLEPFLSIQKERAKAMQELSEMLGMDFTFSEDEIMKNALDEYAKAVKKEFDKVVSSFGRS
jgi:hypothetical protein